MLAVVVAMQFYSVSSGLKVKNNEEEGIAISGELLLPRSGSHMVYMWSGVVIQEEGQENVNHGYRRNSKGHFVGVITLGEKIQPILPC